MVTRKGEMIVVTQPWRSMCTVTHEGHNQPHWETRGSGEVDPAFDIWRAESIASQARRLAGQAR